MDSRLTKYKRNPYNTRCHTRCNNNNCLNTCVCRCLSTICPAAIPCPVNR